MTTSVLEFILGLAVALSAVRIFKLYVIDWLFCRVQRRPTPTVETRITKDQLDMRLAAMRTIASQQSAHKLYQQQFAKINGYSPVKSYCVEYAEEFKGESC